MTAQLDSIIIGGGPAGMSAALVLGRARRNVLVIDEERPRNRVTHATNGFLTRDGISPGEFRKVAREQIAAYPSVRFIRDQAVEITGSDGDFRLKTLHGDSYRSKKLLFASGKKDLPMNIPGLDDVYGRSAFVCPFCDGWELRDKPLALIVNGPQAFHFAKLVSGWSRHIAICTNGPDELADEQREQLAERGIPLYTSPIQQIESSEGIVTKVLLEDGISVPCSGIFFGSKLAPGSDLPAALGCIINEQGVLDVDILGKTNLPGVFGAGDAATPMNQAIIAASMGSAAAAGIVSELAEEDWASRIQASQPTSPLIGEKSWMNRNNQRLS
ncbi:NAD(P)/FAD-dependent oxidoreductase [Paenibacillus sp. D51F]